MEADYPAAHSMDTMWFAVDRDGHVGAFLTGSLGAVPEGATDADLNELLNLLRAAPAGTRLRLGGPLEAETARLGLFFATYECYAGVPLQGNYPLAHRPQAPLHVDQLPPAFRNLARQIRFERVRFPDTERLQPVEHFACRFYPEEDEIAYLASDGVTVRPVPGREGDFAAFCDVLRRDRPEIAERLRFEVAAAGGGPPQINPRG